MKYENIGFRVLKCSSCYIYIYIQRAVSFLFREHILGEADFWGFISLITGQLAGRSSKSCHFHQLLDNFAHKMALNNISGHILDIYPCLL